MNRTLIYINDELVDILPDTVVATTFKAFEIGDITSRNTSFTNRFKLPKTGRNKQILGFADDVNSQTDIPYIKLKAKVVQNGIEILREASVIVSKVDQYFNIELYAGNFGFFAALGERRLDDLLQTKEPQLTDFPFANSLLKQIFFNDGSLNEAANPLAYAGRLGIKYKDVLDLIITTNGYTATGDVLNNTKLNALYMVTPAFQNRYNFKFCRPKEFDAYRAVISPILNVGTSYQKINFTRTVYNGGFYNNTNTYQVVDPEFGGTYFYMNAYAVVIISSVTFFSGATRLQVQLFSASGTYTIPDITTPGTYFLELSDNIVQDPNGSPVTKVTGIDGLQVYVQIRTVNNSGTPTGSAQVALGTNSRFWNRCLQEIPTATAYRNTGGVMPDLLQRDFMKDFAVRCGVLFRERGGVLECKTLNEIIADRANAVDWTTKRVPSPEDEMLYEFRSYGQNNLFQYGSNDELTNEETGQGNLEIANDNLEDEVSIYTSPFNSSFTRKNGNADAGFITAANIPIVEDGEDTNDPGLRLLMVRAPRSFEPDIDFGSGPTSDYNVGYFEDVDGLEGQDAGFQHALNEFYPNLTTYLQKTKTVTYYYRLNEIDIAALDLFTLVYDSGVYYLINTVENFVPGFPTKVQLFKVS